MMQPEDVMSLTYMLRDGPGGSIEIVEFQPRVLAVCPRREDADRLLILLQAGDAEPAAHAPPSRAAARVVTQRAAHAVCPDVIVAPEPSIAHEREATAPQAEPAAEPNWPAMFARLETGAALTEHLTEIVARFAAHFADSVPA